MIDSSFDACWDRLERADEHRSALATIWNAYLESEPFDVSPDFSVSRAWAVLGVGSGLGLGRGLWVGVLGRVGACRGLCGGGCGLARSGGVLRCRGHRQRRRSDEQGEVVDLVERVEQVGGPGPVVGEFGDVSAAGSGEPGCGVPQAVAEAFGFGFG